MFGSAQPDTPFPPPTEPSAPAGSPQASGLGNLEGHELDAALQLLVERAQYITGATGAALALSEGEEMVCRASTGSSGPAVGARLQVRSGLSGESIARKQLLRCDNAETDARVNIETCRQLGIASIVVLPLLSRSGEVRGVFELFSDHPYAFEERDLIALERMADLTLTALDLAERKPRVVVAPPSVPHIDPQTVPQTQSQTEVEVEVKTEPKSAPKTEPEPKAAEPPAGVVTLPLSAATPPDQVETAPYVGVVDPRPAPVSDHPLGAAQVHSALFQDAVSEPPPAVVPEAMRRVQKCTSCGFPVSEGRSLCVDCENKRHSPPESAEAGPHEFVPAFLDSSAPVKESWVANHVNVLAVLVLILSIVVAVVVFR